MSKALEHYLDQVMAYANLPEERARSVRDELRDHLQTAVEERTTNGMPIEDAVFEAVRTHGHPRIVGYTLRPRFGLVDVRLHGTARGIIAIGPRAVGVVAMGAVAYGGIAFGAVAIGGIAIGGVSIALLAAWAGLAISLLGVAFGGVAMALFASGGVAVGVVAVGQVAVGVFAAGVHAVTIHEISDAPGWIVSIARALPGGRTWMGWFGGLFIAIWVPFMILFTVLNARERLRLRGIDAELIE